MNLTYVVQSGRPDLDSELELIRSMWGRIGVELTVKRYLVSQFFGPARDGGIIAGGKFDVARFGWTVNPDEPLGTMYSCNSFPPVGENIMYWCDPQATAALAREDGDSTSAPVRTTSPSSNAACTIKCPR